jgi:hypothetical protein
VLVVRHAVAAAFQHFHSPPFCQTFYPFIIIALFLCRGAFGGYGVGESAGIC